MRLVACRDWRPVFRGRTAPRLRQPKGYPLHEACWNGPPVLPQIEGRWTRRRKDQSAAGCCSVGGKRRGDVERPELGGELLGAPAAPLGIDRAAAFGSGM